MKKLLITLFIAQLVPLSLLAQNDDLYFVPKEKKEAPRVKPKRVIDVSNTYYIGSNRDVDEYNRRPNCRVYDSLEKIGVDSLGNDVYRFNTDSLAPQRGRSIDANYDDDMDYKYTRRMRRYDGYDCHGMDYTDYCESYNSGYNNGYMDGMMSWNVSFGWYDPWWYSSRFYGWNGWYNAYYFGGWNNPWYYGWGWYDPWWYGGYYRPVHHIAYYSGYSGTRNHSRGSYYGSSRRNNVYNGHSRRGSYRDRNGFDSDRRSRGFGNNNRGNNRSWNNRNDSRNENRHTIDRSGFGNNNRSHGGGFGGGSRSGGGGRSNGGGRFGGGR